MHENYMPLARVAAIFNISEDNALCRVLADGFVFQCIAVGAQQASAHDPEGVGAALEQLAKDARNGKGDYNQRGLALALGLKGTESEEEIITYLRGIAHKLYPELEKAKALSQRTALIGLSADHHRQDDQFRRGLVAEKQKDRAHVIALNAAIDSYKRKKGCDFQTAFTAVMQPRPIAPQVASQSVATLSASHVGLGASLVIGIRRKISDSTC